VTDTRDLADLIARELQNTDHRDVGNIQTRSLGNVVAFSVYPRDRHGVTQGEPVEFHAIIHPGAFEVQP
jgi:hypothetical protein